MAGFPGDNVCAVGQFPDDAVVGDIGLLVDVRNWSSLEVGVWFRYESKVTISTKFGPCDVLRLVTRDEDVIRVFATRIVAEGVADALTRKPTGRSLFVKSRGMVPTNSGGSYCGYGTVYN